ncbi:AAA family ATPase [Tenacibaculum maritimum]|uniref:AAA family ATPase n=1 Tax=Tenacibaculum maritimum TaxID=107401 RepID=UPI0023071B60|nr:AAA family ATPase [Tenacibaculum maritimum]MDB0612875.1 AAA family ATPase [Tenacibaculum maritimum]
MMTIKKDLFELYHDYLSGTRKGQIADNTIDSYTERAKEEIPKRWEEYYQVNFDTFKVNYRSLRKITPLLEIGFSGCTSFRPFISSLLDKFKTSNEILYGPPGTGKTYGTKKLAVELIDGVSCFNEGGQKDRENLIKRYNELVTKGQIVFTTFHQSMGYEDFVEGIKPKTEGGKVTYEVEDGIFKKLVNKAKGIKGEIVSETSIVDFRNANYFKMSVGGKNLKHIHDWCIENNCIALGYGAKNDLSQLVDLEENVFRREFKEQYSEEIERSSYSLTAATTFISWLEKGDIVLVSLGNHIIDAIGVVRGDYKYDETAPIPYHHFREVEWLATNLAADPSLFVDKNISQRAIYQFDNDDIKISYFEETFANRHDIKEKKDYVLIIDEINRGNISAIFGELITLLEPDKRLEKNEAITVTLPYSKKEFGVPSNLHIIGTMNTADRSIEALDTALRRRFNFKEVMPDPSLLRNIEFDEFNLEKVLTTINDRMEVLLNREHTIGHSYFINIESGDTKALSMAFNNNVVPLLQEYFYGDYGKIGLVLGKGFVEKKANFELGFADFDYRHSNDLRREVFQLKKVAPDYIEKAICEMLNISGINTTLQKRTSAYANV